MLKIMKDTNKLWIIVFVFLMNCTQPTRQTIQTKIVSNSKGMPSSIIYSVTGSNEVIKIILSDKGYVQSICQEDTTFNGYCLFFGDYSGIRRIGKWTNGYEDGLHCFFEDGSSYMKGRYSLGKHDSIWDYFHEGKIAKKVFYDKAENQTIIFDNGILPSFPDLPK
jgi:hypothetical protein